MNANSGWDLRQALLSCQTEHKEAHSWYLWLFSAHEAGKLSAADEALVRYLSNVNLLADLFSGSSPHLIPMPGVSAGLQGFIKELETQAQTPEVDWADAPAEVDRKQHFTSIMKSLEDVEGDVDITSARKEYYRLVKGCTLDVDEQHHRKVDDKVSMRAGINKVEYKDGLLLPVCKTGSVLL
eukprot:jgi/Botrbrau1/2673/Bobra.0203s0019.1